MLKPLHLQTLTAVVRAGSFSQAGRELGYTSSAVAQQVAALERELGLPLFVREPQRIRPTPAALLLAQRGRHALDLLESLEHEARAVASGQLGRISIGSALDAGSGLLADTMSRLKDSGPGLDIEIHDGTGTEVLDRVQMGSLDLGLVYDYAAAPRELSPEVNSLSLDDAPLRLVTPSQWHGVSRIGELAECDWFVGLDAPEGERALRALCCTAGFEPRVRVSSENPDLVFGLVAAELGVGIVPTLPWPAPAGVEVGVLSEESATRRTIAVYLRRHGNRQALRSTLRAARQATARPEAETASRDSGASAVSVKTSCVSRDE
jgi:DNA-binding transcriptional LysR family regulator